MSTPAPNGVVSLSFRPRRSLSHGQITTDLGGPGPLELRVVLALDTGPYVMFDGGGSLITPHFAVSNGYDNIAIAPAHAGAHGGGSLEAAQTDRVFSATAR
jgi:hypothetical protein